MDRDAVGQRLGVDRADVLHRVVDGADAGRQEQPFRRVDSRGRVQDHAARHHLRVAVALLHLPHRVGAAGGRGELASREGGGHRDRAHSGRVHRRALGAAVGMDPRTERVELAGLGHAVPQAEPDHLGGVGHRPATDGQQRVRPGLARRVGRGHHVDARRVGADLRTHARQPVAENGAHPIHHVGLPCQRAAGEHKDGVGADALDLLRKRFDERHAVDHPVHRRVAVDTLLHGGQPFSLQKASSAATSSRSAS